MSARQEHLQVVPLLKMEIQDAEDFSARVARYGGRISILVHPYYMDRNPNKPQTYLRYQTRRDRLIATLLKADEPLVIIRDYGFGVRLPLIPDDRTLYSVFGDPQPYDSSWDEMSQVLRRADVREIRLGGVYTTACVEETRAAFKARGFNVRRSLPTHD